MLRALAKGSKREKSSFSGGLELLTRGELVALTKRTSELATLTEWDLQELFWSIRRRLDAHRAGLYLADLLYHAVTDGDPHPALFDTLIDALRMLEEPGAVPVAVLRFQWAVLAETGYKPRLDIDAGSGRPMPRAATYGFAPDLGGLVPDSGSSGPWRVRAATIDLLRGLDAGHISPKSEDDVSRANRLLAVYLRHVLRREVPTMRAVFGRLS